MKNTMASAISKVKQKLKQVKFRHLKAYLSDNLSADPRNCTHNEIRKSSNGVVHTCGYEGSNTYGKICDVSFGKNRAKDCGLFCPKKDKEELKAEFYNFIDSSSIGEIAKEFPDVTALMWVLDTLGADSTDVELKEHYEKIEQVTVENHHLSSTLEDLQNMVLLQTTEIRSLEEEIDRLGALLTDSNADKEQIRLFFENEKEKNETLRAENEELKSLIESDKAPLVEKPPTLWDRLMGWWK